MNMEFRWVTLRHTNTEQPILQFRVPVGNVAMGDVERMSEWQSVPLVVVDGEEFFHAKHKWKRTW